VEVLAHVEVILPLELELAAVPQRPVKEGKLGRALRRGKLLQRRRLRLLLPDKFLPYPPVGKGKQRLLVHRPHHPHRGRGLAA
jgi:hypothetical protein